METLAELAFGIISRLRDKVKSNSATEKEWTIYRQMRRLLAEDQRADDQEAIKISNYFSEMEKNGPSANVPESS